MVRNSAERRRACGWPATFGICLALVTPVWPSPVQPTETPSDGLFVAVEAGPPQGLDASADEIVRQRLVRPDRDRLAAVRVNAGRPGASPPVLRLNLFEDAVLRAVVDDTGPTSAGYWLSGHIAGQEQSSITLVVNGEDIAGTVRVAGAQYAIRSVGGGVLVIRQIDPAALPRLGDDAVRPPPAGSLAAPDAQPIRPPAPDPRRLAAPADAAEAPPEEDGSAIDILVVYTPEARRDHAADGGIHVLIDLLFAETNQAYRQSGVVQRVHLAGTRQVNYDARGRDEVRVLEHLTSPSDGHMDGVHALRDRVAADIVHLMVDDEIRGKAWAAWQFAQWGFNFLGYTGGLFFAHENGHNMGLEHDRYEVVTRGDSPSEHVANGWLRAPYSFGYVNQRMFEPNAPASSRWWTIMAYPDQCRDWAEEHRYDSDDWCFWTGVGPVMRFSNPQRRYSGDRTGVPGGGPSESTAGPADVRRSLNQTRKVIANFRRAPCLRDGRQVTLQASSGQYVVAIGNGGGAVRANRARPGPGGRFTLVDRNGGCVESGDRVSLRTSDGFYLRARQGGGSVLDATAPRPTPWARFVARREPSKRGVVRIRNTISLQAQSGHYVGAERGGGSGVSADSSRVGRWERFALAAK